ncbi:acetyl-CoA carboxylase biotin carboxyl carrier protein [Plantactinospora siamensis]|uniref:Biotin carboxyl carrier protein of acetyl-CoA carboxylase n=1 Tax=Plantactinospora siamensis TaxID=555372 RepID=A0ABV6NWM8_9ACTN
MTSVEQTLNELDAVAVSAARDAEDMLAAVVRRAAELAAAGSTPLGRVRLRAGDLCVEVEWQPDGLPGAAATVVAGPDRTTLTGTNGAGPTVVTGPVTVLAATEGTSSDAEVLTAPAVGTFYRSPEPGAAPFVAVGDTVAPGQQIGIIEAMKLMNPIEADRAGQVGEILVEDGAPVEYGQPLIVLTPTSHP